MLHFCLVFFIILLNKTIALIISTLTLSFVSNAGINGKIMYKKNKPLEGLVCDC